MSDFRLSRPLMATRRTQPTLWEVRHPDQNASVRFGHITQVSSGWRSYDWRGRPLDSHRIMTRTQSAQLVADNYRKRYDGR